MMHIPFQPVGYHHYFSPKTIKIPKTLTHLFYVSWEDTLWDILSQKRVSRNSTVLLPEFFCQDVVSSMKLHGLVPKYYPVDKNFQTNPAVFAKYLNDLQPDIVIILHAVGITNRLFAQNHAWIKKLKSSAILIEDSVHRVVDPSQIKLITPHHLVIDSLRKVVPVPGSNLYGSKDFINFSSPAWNQAFLYQQSVFGFWFLFQLLLNLSSLFPISRIKNHLLKASEKLMLLGYDKIGKSYTPASGWFVWKWMSLHLNLEKIHTVKTRQAVIYKQTLSPLKSNPFFINIHIPSSDYKELRGYPLVLAKKTSQNFIDALRNRGLIFRFELNDSIWGRGASVIYLPIGPHLKNEQIKAVCKDILECAKLKL